LAATLLLGFAAYPVFGQSGAGTLRVAIRDKASGEVVPAAVCITSLADGTWRIPPDGQTIVPFVTNKDFIASRLKSDEYIAGPQKPWSPGDIGPPIPMNGDFHDNDQRHSWMDGLASMPFWKEPVAYFVSKPFTITLPPGKWRLAVQRGIEYLPVFEEFTVTAGQKLDRDIRMARWVDMPKQGWYSGDGHVHSKRTAPLHDVFLMTWARAMDVHMTCVLSYDSKNNANGAIQKGYGRATRLQQGDWVLDSGHEGPREDIPDQGHMTQIDIQKMVRDADRYHLYDLIADAVHEQGGMVGYTHMAWAPEFYRKEDPSLNPGWDATINIIRGKADFIDVLESAHIALEDYYDFLNLGIKLTAMAGSDAPATMIGEERVYAYTGPHFTGDTWYAAVKHGHTFVTNGPMLNLEVGKAIPGDEVRVGKNAKMRIRATAWGPESIGAPKVLEVVSHGRVIRTVKASSPSQNKLSAEFDFEAGESQWIAARATASNGAVAHTSPVYVIVDGASFLDRSQLQQIVEKRLKVLDFVVKRLHEPTFTRKRYPPEEVTELLARVQDAREKYLALERTQSSRNGNKDPLPMPSPSGGR
jgi:hypothetical protein